MTKGLVFEKSAACNCYFALSGQRHTAGLPAKHQQERRHAQVDKTPPQGQYPRQESCDQR